MVEVSINKQYPDGDIYSIVQDTDYPSILYIKINDETIGIRSLTGIIRDVRYNE